MNLFRLTPSKERLRDCSQKVWGKTSGDPAHAENKDNADWQSGYLLGCHTIKASTDDICEEWKKRGEPKGSEQTDDTVPERVRVSAWRSWKAGYWAGRYTHL